MTITFIKENKEVVAATGQILEKKRYKMGLIFINCEEN